MSENSPYIPLPIILYLRDTFLILWHENCQELYLQSIDIHKVFSEKEL